MPQHSQRSNYQANWDRRRLKRRIVERGNPVGYSETRTIGMTQFFSSHMSILSPM